MKYVSIILALVLCSTTVSAEKGFPTPRFSTEASETLLAFDFKDYLPGFKRRAQEVEPADPELSFVSVSNITSASAVITWASKTRCVGSIKYGTTQQLGRMVKEDTPDHIHSIRLRGLSEGETIYYKVHSGSSESKILSFQTAAVGAGFPRVVYGVIPESIDSSYPDAMIKLKIIGSSGTSLPLSIPVPLSGMWMLNLGNLKTSTGQPFFWNEEMTAEVKVEGLDERGKPSVLLSYTVRLANAPDGDLSQIHGDGSTAISAGPVRVFSPSKRSEEFGPPELRERDPSPERQFLERLLNTGEEALRVNMKGHEHPHVIPGWRGGKNMGPSKPSEPGPMPTRAHLRGEVVLREILRLREERGDAKEFFPDVARHFPKLSERLSRNVVPVPLYEGINIVALPVDPYTSVTSYSFLQDVTGAQEVTAWDGELQQFGASAMWVGEEILGDDFPFELGYGYFTTMDSTGQATFEGDPLTSIEYVPIYAGLEVVSLVGSSDSMTSYSVFDGLFVGIEICQLSPQLQSYQCAFRVGETVYGDEFPLEEGSGYFVRAEETGSFPSDSTLPSLTITSPVNGDEIYTRQPFVEIIFGDHGSGLVLETFSCLVNGEDKTFFFTVDELGATWQMGGPEELAESLNTIQANIFDLAGNERNVISIFNVVTTPPPEDEHFVNGYVFHGETWEPLEEVAVALEGIPGVIYTDTSGHYVFPTPGLGEYRINIEKEHFTYAQRYLLIEHGHGDAFVDDAYLSPRDSVVTRITPEGGVAVNSDGSIFTSFPPNAVEEDIDAIATEFDDSEDLPSLMPELAIFTYCADFGPEGEVLLDSVFVDQLNWRGFSEGTSIPIGHHNSETMLWEDEGMAYVGTDGTWFEFELRHFSPVSISAPVIPDPGAPGIDSSLLEACWVDVSEPVILNPEAPGIDPSLIEACSRDSGLVGYWRFDESEGNIAYDYSGHGNDGGIRGAAWVDDGISGYALDFDGDMDYVNFGNDPSLYPSSMSITHWLRYTVLPADWGYTVNDYDGANGDWGMSVRVVSDGCVIARVGKGGYPQAVMEVRSPTPLNDGDWYFVAATYCNTEKTLELYIGDSDGVELVDENSWTYSLGHKTNPYIDSMVVGICSGYFPYPPPSHYPRCYTGTVDEVRIYDRALSEAEIEDLYNYDYYSVEMRANQRHFSDRCRNNSPPSLGDVGLKFGDNAVRHDLPSVTSLGLDRGLSFSYASHTVQPKIVIETGTKGTPPEFQLPLYTSARTDIAGRRFTGIIEASRYTTRQRIRFDARDVDEEFMTTGLYYHRDVLANLSGSRYATADSFGGPPVDSTEIWTDFPVGFGICVNGDLMVEHRLTSEIGSGWASDGLQRLCFRPDGSAMIVEGGGTAHFYEWLSGLGFWSHDGDFTTLISNPDLVSHTRIYPDSSKVLFDSTGLQTATIDRNGNTTTYEYDEQERLTSVTYPGSLVTHLEYDPDGYLETVTDPAGRVTHFEHDVDGNLISITDPDSSFWRYEYDENHLLIKTIDPRENETTYEYDESGYVTGIIGADSSTNDFLGSDAYNTLNEAIAQGQGTPENPADVVKPDELINQFVNTQGDTTYSLTNAYGRRTQKTDVLGRVHNFGYNDDGYPTALTRPDLTSVNMSWSDAGQITSYVDNSNGATSTYIYDPVFNKPTMVINAVDDTTRYELDDRGNTIRSINALGDTTQYFYDDRGLLIKAINALGDSTVNYYNNTGNLDSVRSALGYVTRYEYDAAGNMTAMIDALDNRTEYEYDANGRMILMRDPLGNETEYIYDPSLVGGGCCGSNTHNLLLATINPAGDTTKYDYDEMGRQISVTDPLGNISQTEYDEEGRVTKRIDPEGRWISYGYDDVGNLTSQTDSLGRTVTFEYDSRNRRTATIDPYGRRTEYVYDDVGNLIHLVNANDDTTSFDYDLLSRKTSETDPLSRTKYFKYNPLSSLDTLITAKGDIITYEYDDLSRLVEKQYPVGDVAYQYDATSNVLQVEDDDSKLVMTYDARGMMLTSATGNPGNPLDPQPVTTIEYQYDDAGRIVNMIDPASDTTYYYYNVNSQLDSLIGPDYQLFAFERDIIGRVTELSRPNGTTTDYLYDASSQVTSIVHRNGITLIDSLVYSYNPVGMVQSIIDDNDTSSYDYDSLDQVIAADYTDSLQTNEFFTYDSLSNRTSSHLSSSYDYDKANQIEEDDQHTYVFDANGNMIEKEDKATLDRWEYSYDYENILIGVEKYDGGVSPPSLEATYRYDGQGRRICRIVNSDTTVYIYNGSDILFEYDGSESLLASYVQGPSIDQPLMVTRSDDKYYFHLDKLGSIKALTDNTGAVVQTYLYDSFGNIKHTMSGEYFSPYLFTGREWDDESGLYYYRARYYDSNAGRFLQTDPIFAINPYVYVGNDPTNMTDPTGQERWKISGGSWEMMIVFVKVGGTHLTAKSLDSDKCCTIVCGKVGFGLGLSGGLGSIQGIINDGPDDCEGFGKGTFSFEASAGLGIAEASAGVGVNINDTGAEVDVHSTLSGGPFSYHSKIGTGDATISPQLRYSVSGKVGVSASIDFGSCYGSPCKKRIRRSIERINNDERARCGMTSYSYDLLNRNPWLLK